MIKANVPALPGLQGIIVSFATEKPARMVALVLTEPAIAPLVTMGMIAPSVAQPALHLPGIIIVTGKTATRFFHNTTVR